MFTPPQSEARPLTPATPVPPAAMVCEANVERYSLLIAKAAFIGDYKAIEHYILLGGLCSSRDASGQTPLHYACREGYASIVRLLIAEGAIVDEQDNNGDTALHVAARDSREGIVKMLLSAGANSSIKNNRGESPMEVALKKLE